MNKTWKRWGALLLALVMALSLLPASALAARIDDTERPAVPAEDDGGHAAAPAVMEDDPPATPFAEGDDTYNDIDTAHYTVCVPSENARTHNSEGPQRYAIDNNMGTFWHSDRATEASGRWIAIELDEAAWVSAFRYRPRSDTTGNALTGAGNGIVEGYRVEISNDELDAATLANTNSDDAATRTAARAAYAALTWTPVASGTWDVTNESGNFNGAWQVAEFTAVQAKRIRLVGVTTRCNSAMGDNTYMHAAEIRVVAAPAATTYTVSGTVTDGANPLEGAVVNIGGATATTDETGAYSVTLRAGTYAISVTLDGYEVTDGGTVEVPDADVTGHLITMEQVSRKITGTVTDGLDGLVGATVTLVQVVPPYTTVPGVSATTGENGSFEMNVNSLAAGNYKVRAAKTGYGAAIGVDPVEVNTENPTATFNGGTVALTAIGQADYSYDMTTQLPAFTTGASTAFNQEGGERVIRFNGTSHSANQVRLTGINAADVTVEFDATRSGTGTTAGFGVALRHTDADNYLYVGQADGNNWHSSGVSGGNSGSGTALSGPSFLPGDTRHFKVTLAQDNGTAKVSLWIDGIQVINNETAGNGHCPATAGAVAFVCGGNNTSVAVKDLYITRADSKYTITMPDTLTAYVFGADTSLPAGSATGTFLASAGDVVNVYSAHPATTQMTAPLTVYHADDGTTVSSTENILHVTHNGSANKERGYYVQFRMPAYDVTLTPAALKTYLTGVTLETNGETGAVTATVSPAGATASFRWFREGTTENTWTLIEDATNATYAPQSADAGHRLKAEATGTGSYCGVVEAATRQMAANPVTGVSILRTTSEPEVVDVGGTVTLRATITPAQDVDFAVTWASGDTGKVTVEGVAVTRDEKMDASYATATVTGVAAGTATITITAGGKTDTRQVTVGKAVTNVIFEESSVVTLYTNGSGAKTARLTPTVNPSDATNKALTWWSTDETVATVDQSGLVTAVAPGTAEIYVRSQQKPGLQTHRTVRVVTLPTALELDVTNVELTLRPGSAPGTQVVVPTLTPDNASDKTIVWKTDNSAVATVTKPWANDTGSQNALITAQGVGQTTITATSAADGTLVKTVTVTVKQQLVGQAAVSGELKFGSELTADVNDITEAAKNDLTYAWYRGETATGTPLATTKTYTPVKEDIGQKLTVKVTAGGYYLGSTTYTTGTIAKADGPIIPGAGASGIHGEPATAAGNDGRIVGFPADDGNTYEYKPVDSPDSAYREVAGTAVAGLAVGDYNVRIAETDTHKAGTPITVTVAPHDVTLHLINIGTMTPADAGTVTRRRGQAEEGEERVLTVRPAEGYQLKENGLTVTGDVSHTAVQLTKGETTEDGKTYETYTFTMPGEAVTVEAEFELKTYTIGHALTNITCSMGAEENHTATHGTPFTITLTPADGYEMPRSLTVTATATNQRFTDYTYTAAPNNAEARVLTFAHGVTQDVTVRGDGVLKTFPVEYVRERVSFLSAPARAGWHQEFVAAVTPDEGYQLPDAITVTMGGQAFTDFTYTKETGAIYIAADVVEDALTITVRGEQKIVPLEKVSISGIAKVGERLTANITPAEADGHVTYQWCWATLDSNGAIVGEPTEITGATGRSRAITTLSEGKSIVMKVTAVEGSGFSGTVLSQPTGEVVAADADGVMPTLVQIRRANVSIAVGGTDTLVAYVAPSDATNKTVLWETSDPAVVTVDNGVITGVAPGTATITVTAEADERIKDTCVVTVTGLRPVQATATDVEIPYDGLAHGIQVVVTDPVDGSAGVTYSSDGVNFHAANPTFSAVGEHMVWYKVAANGRAGVQGQAKVTITKATPEIKITASRSTLSAAGEVTLTVTLPEYADRTGFYVEASDLMLPMTRNEDGTYTVELPGNYKTYTFTATLLETDNYEQTTASCTVRVGATSGGSSSSGTTTETKEDGTKVTTVTKPDGTVTETTETPDGTVAVVETKPDGSKTQTVEQPDGTKSEMEVTKDGDVTITVTDESGEELVKAEIPAAIPKPEAKFEDVDTTPWAEEAINKVAGLELVNGTGGNKYSPVAPMTRGSLATVLHRLSQGKTDYENTFKDVARGKYYTEGVTWAAKAKVVTGYTADIFAPDDVITREQLAVMLARYAKLVGLNTKADAKALESFTDGDATGAWAVDGVAWCVENGILKGKGQNNLDPTADVTRAEVAVMLDRFIALLK